MKTTICFFALMIITISVSAQAGDAERRSSAGQNAPTSSPAPQRSTERESTSVFQDARKAMQQRGEESDEFERVRQQEDARRNRAKNVIETQRRLEREKAIEMQQQVEARRTPSSEVKEHNHVQETRSGSERSNCQESARASRDIDKSHKHD